MPLNLIRKYPELLELAHLNEPQRRLSLLRIFARDIENNTSLAFGSKQIRPLKIEGQATMQTLYGHLTTKEDKDGKGKKLGTRSFEMARSVRLHWVRCHLDETAISEIDVFSYEDRIEGRGDVIRTYIYDITQEYVVVLEPQRSGRDYYLLTAYHLNEPGGRKQIEKKRKKKLPDIH